MPWKPFSSTRSISISYRQEAVSKHRGPRNRSVVGKLVRDRFGSKTVVTPLKWDVCITPESRRRSSTLTPHLIIVASKEKARYQAGLFVLMGTGGSSRS